MRFCAILIVLVILICLLGSPAGATLIDISEPANTLSGSSVAVSSV